MSVISKHSKLWVKIFDFYNQNHHQHLELSAFNRRCTNRFIITIAIINLSVSLNCIFAIYRIFVFYVSSIFLADCIPLLVQQRVHGSLSTFFNRSWAEFKVGFNASNGNYWLGNDMLHQLTKDNNYKLRVEFQLTSGLWHWAEYTRFIVHSEAANYMLVVGGFSGSAGDALSYHDRRLFSTWDRENDDQTGGNCGVQGGFWYQECCHCCISPHNDFKWHNTVNSTWLDLKTARLWLACH